MAGLRAAAGERREWRMGGGDVTITEKSELFCSLTRNWTEVQAKGRRKS